MVAKKHPMLDEVPVVFIIPLAGVEGVPADLHDNVMIACRNGLADFKVPREIHFVDELPRSTLEKVAKAELRKMLGYSIGALLSRHCERKRSNPSRGKSGMDCFVAYAPRNDGCGITI